MNRFNKLIGLASFVMVISSACSTAPEQLKGEYSTLRPMDVSEQNLETPIRWAGVIFETLPQESHTCIAVLAKPIEKSMRPQMTGQSDGRFIACTRGYYDPDILKVEGGVTLTGRIIHIDKRAHENYDYLVPVVEVDSITLWQKRSHTGWLNPYEPLSVPRVFRRHTYGPWTYQDTIYWGYRPN